jgi:hypothetical protein
MVKFGGKSSGETVTYQYNRLLRGGTVEQMFPLGDWIDCGLDGLWSSHVKGCLHYRGTPLIRNSTPLWDNHRVLGIVLLQGPTGALLLMSEEPV